MTRRGFLGLVSSSAIPQTRSAIDLSRIPNFCSHEHWGSIDSIGTFPGGYRADLEQEARPSVETGLYDLLIDPYLRGVLTGAGANHETLSRGSGWKWFSDLQSVLEAYRFIGVYQCTRRGIQSLYGADIDNLSASTLSRLESLIAERYRNPFSWYPKAMAQAHFSRLVRPVHPEYYRNQQSPETAAGESAFTRTVMRIDPFVDFHTLPPERRQRMIAVSGIEPRDESTWRKFLAYWFDAAAKGAAVGIKQLQAYRRSLDFQTQTDGLVRWNGTTPEEVRKRQDWIVHECCRQAHERSWAHQVHVGTNNLGQSSPLPLLALSRQYPRMKVVMIHCWPFIAESGTLARQTPNIYIDTCWQPILNPQFFRQAMTEWWNYVPSHKITCGHDATTVEMAAGSALFTREILSEILQDQLRQGTARLPALINAARAVLHNNACQIYGFGKAI